MTCNHPADTIRRRTRRAEAAVRNATDMPCSNGHPDALPALAQQRDAVRDALRRDASAGIRAGICAITRHVGGRRRAA